MRFARRWIVLIVLAGVPLTPASAALEGVQPRQEREAQQAQAATQALDPELMGMVVRDPWFDFGTNPAFPGQSNQAFQDRMGVLLAQSGVRWVRMDFRIAANEFQPLTSELVQSEIAKNDYFVNVVAPRHGFKVLGLLAFDLLQGVDANRLNEDDLEDYIQGSKYGGGVNQYMEVWLDRALAIADRYRDKIAAYQVLNEQNRLPTYVDPALAGTDIRPHITGRVVTKFYRFCRGIEVPTEPPEPVHGCRDAQIILGGLHPRGTGDPKITMTDAEYLKQIYADRGSFGIFHERHGRWPIDGIGYHPYPEEIRLSDKDALVDKGVARIRAALVEAGDPCVPTWITEVGYNVGFDVDGPANPIPQQTEHGQADFMRDVYTSLAARQICGGQREVAHIFWFKYEDFPPATGANAQRWGIVRIPFRAPASGENCPGGACYEVNGNPEIYRLSYFTYRELAGLPVQRIHLPLTFR
jgi:hypothetical protein